MLRYEKGGYFDVHHGSTAFLRRYATLLYYLDGPGEGNGGGTVFPLGPDGTGGVGAGAAGGGGGAAATAAAAAAIGGGNITEACNIGVVVSPTPGDAVLFYNFEPEVGLYVSRRSHALSRPVHTLTS